MYASSKSVGGAIARARARSSTTPATISQGRIFHTRKYQGRVCSRAVGEPGGSMRRFMSAVLLVAATGAIAHAENVDDIIAKNLKARGGLDKLKSIQSLRMTGKMMIGDGLEAPFTIELKRPKRMRIEFTFQGMTGTQALDGDMGWAIVPFTGKKDPERMTPDDLKEAQEQADFDGPLMDYKSKGNKVELAGKEKIEGTD